MDALQKLDERDLSRSSSFWSASMRDKSRGYSQNGFSILIGKFQYRAHPA
jgi:hypothetical protein